MHDASYRANESQLTAAALWGRLALLVASGLGRAHAMTWGWPWSLADFGRGRRSFKVTYREMGRELGMTDDGAARSLLQLERWRLVYIGESKRGRGEYPLLEVFDPAEVLKDGPQRLDGDPQLALPVIENEPAAAENPTEVAAVVGFVAPQDGPATALVSTLQSHLGHERWEVWLAGCRFELADGALTIYAPTEFHQTYIRRAFSREFAVICREACDASLRVEVDDATAAAQSTPMKTRLELPIQSGLKPQERKFGLETPMKGALNQETNKQATAAAQLPTAAARLYAAVGDSTTYRWIAILAELHVAEGRLTSAALNTIVAEARESGDFANRIASLGGRRGC